MTHKEWCEDNYGGSVGGEPIPDYACTCERREGERRKTDRAFSKLLKPKMRGPDRRKRDD